MVPTSHSTITLKKSPANKSLATIPPLQYYCKNITGNNTTHHRHRQVALNTYIISTSMPHPHPNYPPILPRTALLGPLHPYPMAWRDELANRLQARGIQISRAFLALCNLNLIEYTSGVNCNYIQTAFHDSTDRQITTLSQSLNLPLREWQPSGYVVLQSPNVYSSMLVSKDDINSHVIETTSRAYSATSLTHRWPIYSHFC